MRTVDSEKMDEKEMVSIENTENKIELRNVKVTEEKQSSQSTLQDIKPGSAEVNSEIFAGTKNEDKEQNHDQTDSHIEIKQTSADNKETDQSKSMSPVEDCIEKDNNEENKTIELPFVNVKNKAIIKDDNKIEKLVENSTENTTNNIEESQIEKNNVNIESPVNNSIDSLDNNNTNILISANFDVGKTEENSKMTTSNTDHSDDFNTKKVDNDEIENKNDDKTTTEQNKIINTKSDTLNHESSDKEKDDNSELNDNFTNISNKYVKIVKNDENTENKVTEVKIEQEIKNKQFEEDVNFINDINEKENNLENKVESETKLNNETDKEQLGNEIEIENKEADQVINITCHETEDDLNNQSKGKKSLKDENDDKLKNETENIESDQELISSVNESETNVENENNYENIFNNDTKYTLIDKTEEVFEDENQNEQKSINETESNLNYESENKPSNEIEIENKIDFEIEEAPVSKTNSAEPFKRETDESGLSNKLIESNEVFNQNFHKNGGFIENVSPENNKTNKGFDEYNMDFEEEVESKKEKNDSEINGNIFPKKEENKKIQENVEKDDIKSNNESKDKKPENNYDFDFIKDFDSIENSENNDDKIESEKNGFESVVTEGIRSNNPKRRISRINKKIILDKEPVKKSTSDKTKKPEQKNEEKVKNLPITSNNNLMVNDSNNDSDISSAFSPKIRDSLPSLFKERTQHSSPTRLQRTESNKGLENDELDENGELKVFKSTSSRSPVDREPVPPREERVRRGDERVVNPLYKRHGKPLYLRMIAQAKKKQMKEERMKNERYAREREARSKNKAPNREEIRQHMARHEQLLKQKHEENKQLLLQQQQGLPPLAWNKQKSPKPKRKISKPRNLSPLPLHSQQQQGSGVEESENVSRLSIESILSIESKNPKSNKLPGLKQNKDKIVVSPKSFASNFAVENSEMDEKKIDKIMENKEEMVLPSTSRSNSGRKSFRDLPRRQELPIMEVNQIKSYCAPDWVKLMVQ